MATINSISNKITNNSFTIGNKDASAAASNLYVQKDRSGGVITANDALGQIKFTGHDGTAFITASQITSTNSGTVATDRIASDLKFYTHPDTATGSAGSTLRMTIAPAGNITIAAPDAGTALTITNGGLTVTAGNTTLTPLNAAGHVINNASGVLSTAATTQYALQLGSATGAFASLALGTAGQILTSAGAGADCAWTTATYPATVATGDIISATNTNVVGVIAGTGATAGYVLTGNGSGVAPTWQANASALTWSEETGATVALAADHAYIMNRGTAITATLPGTCAIYKTIKILGKGAGLTIIAQNANQMIHYDTVTTTTGVGGSLTATSSKGVIELVCTVADLEFTVVSSTSNWDYV